MLEGLDRLPAARLAVEEGRRRFGVQSPVGMMVIESARRRSTVLLGSQSHTSSPGDGAALAVVDWRTAPLAEIYFGLAEGESWDGPGGSVRLLMKQGLEVREGQVSRVFAPRETLFASGPSRPRRPKRLTVPKGRGGFRSPLDVTLDPAQQRIVDLPRAEPTLILGEAGFGKTTVALRRLEALARLHGPGFRGAAVVPTEGLRRLTARALERRGLGHLEVWTWEGWVRHEAHKAFRLPRRESLNASSRTITLKRHPALTLVLEAFADGRRRATARRDLLHLFGDTAWLARVVEASGGALHVASVAEVAAHTHVQFLQTTERRFADVTDVERLRTVDGAPIDSGTPDEDAETVDVEDYAVLFALEAARAERAGRRPRALARWDALVIDEAQELAPIELELLRRALKPSGSLIVAGDAAQQVDPTTSFVGWDAVMTALGAPRHTRVVLEVGYRCPPEVTALARRVLGGELDLVEAPAIQVLDAPHEAQALVDLIDALRDFSERSPSATVALIARSPELARLWARWLGHALPVHLALDGDFPFGPGLIATCVAEVKGLEFDVVILPDPRGSAWSSTPEARRGLYVGLTRASHQLVLTAPARG